MSESPEVIETSRGTLKYKGDRTGTYDHERGTGIVGKIVGPNLHGQWFVVTDARYDVDEDTTYASLLPIQSPAAVFDRVVAE